MTLHHAIADADDVSDLPDRSPASSVFKCLACGAPLAIGAAQASCAACTASWPVRDGIARFFDPTYYWGEIPQSEATAFLREAEQDGWRATIARRFANDRDFLTSVLDTQRTSWIPMLGLRPDAVALDIGSGYGALTHALSQQVAEVYSVEAIPERVDFTRVRLAQEGITNVHIVQGSALELPLLNGMFDLIVVNGVLEWLGEWDTERDPREVQVRFLQQLHRLLKPDGIVVIGIENRIGAAAFLGDLDHSGVPYTSLMPRWMASLYLRHDQRQHHRTVLNEARQYRTYTYSEWGYRRLLARSGFTSSSFYWADPGYNQPYALVPLRESFARRHLEASLDHAPPARVKWRRAAKRAWAKLRLLRPLVSEFLIVAERQAHTGASRSSGDRVYRSLQSQVPELPRIAQPVASLYAYPFGRKTLIRIFESDSETPTLFVRTSTPAPGSKADVAAEFRNLSLLRSQLEGSGTRRFDMPQAVGRCSLARLDCTVESAAPGTELTDILRGHFRARRIAAVRREMERCLEIAVDIRRTFTAARELASIDPAWAELPGAVLGGDGDRAALQALIESSRATLDDQCVQHGDFTIENIVIDAPTGRVTVVDWEHAARGLPSWYDSFSALISLLAVMPPARPVNGSVVETNFRDGFFHGGRWTSLTAYLIALAFEQHAIDTARAWPLFLQFLSLRTQFYASRGSTGAAADSARMLETMWRDRDRFVFPPATA